MRAWNQPARAERLLCAVLVSAVFAIASDASLVFAQTGAPELTRAKLEVGAGFLKSGDVEIATKTFTQILDADATNWQARALLAIAYLSAKDLAKAETELRRLKTQGAPAATVAGLERQVIAQKQSQQLRDQITTLLQAGKWHDAVKTIDVADLTEPRRNLLRAYIAALRGEFDEARRLTSDPQFASFNASIEKRAEEYGVAREKALVALNHLGVRACYNKGHPAVQRCPNHPRLTGTQQTAWDEIMSAGKGQPQFAGYGLEAIQANHRAWVQWFEDSSVAALSLLSGFVSLAPLSAESVQAGVVLSFFSGAPEGVRAAAERSINATGSWMLKTRMCSGSECWLGVGGKMRKAFPEGLLVFDTRVRAVRYFTVQPSSWLISLMPVPGALIFEVPFDRIVLVKSRPKVVSSYGVTYLELDSLLFDFGPKSTVPLPDFVTLLGWGDLIPLLLKSLGDVLNVAGQLIPTAKIDYQPDVKGGGPGFLSTALVASALRAAGNIQASQQILAEAQQLQAADVFNRAQLWQQLSELKAQDGTSVVDAALEDESLKQDLDALLRLSLQAQ